MGWYSEGYKMKTKEELLEAQTPERRKRRSMNAIHYYRTHKKEREEYVKTNMQRILAYQRMRRTYVRV